jgi:hypothetical protein
VDKVLLAGDTISSSGIGCSAVDDCFVLHEENKRTIAAKQMGFVKYGRVLNIKIINGKVKVNQETNYYQYAIRSIN